MGNFCPSLSSWRTIVEKSDQEGKSVEVPLPPLPPLHPLHPVAEFTEIPDPPMDPPTDKDEDPPKVVICVNEPEDFESVEKPEN